MPKQKGKQRRSNGNSFNMNLPLAKIAFWQLNPSFGVDFDHLIFNEQTTFFYVILKETEKIKPTYFARSHVLQSIEYWTMKEDINRRKKHTQINMDLACMESDIVPQAYKPFFMII